MRTSRWAEQPKQALARCLPSDPPAPDAADKKLYIFMHGSVYAPVIILYSIIFILICMYMQSQLCSSLASYSLVLTETHELSSSVPKLKTAKLENAMKTSVLRS